MRESEHNHGNVTIFLEKRTLANKRRKVWKPLLDGFQAIRTQVNTAMSRRRMKSDAIGDMLLTV